MPTEPVAAADEPGPQASRDRLARAVPAVLWTSTIILVFGAAITSFLDPTPDPPGSPDEVFVPLIVALVTSLGSVGALLALRRAANVIGWLMLGGASLIAFAVATVSFQQYAAATGRGFAAQLPEWVSGVAFQAGLVLQVLVVLVFPDGRLPRRGRPILAVVLSGLALSTIGGAIETEPSPGQGPLEVIGNLVLVLGVGLAAWSVLSRLRAAQGDERKQLEWFTWVAGVLAIALAVASLQLGPISDVAWVVSFAAFAALPIAIAIAVMKYRLYDIDALVNRTLVYAPLIGILGGIFAAGTAVLQRLFIEYTGSTSDAAVVMSTLIVAGTFTPVRKALERAVERRFASSDGHASEQTPNPAGSAGGTATEVLDISVLLDDPRLAARIEEIATRVADEGAHR